MLIKKFESNFNVTKLSVICILIIKVNCDLKSLEISKKK